MDRTLLMTEMYPFCAVGLSNLMQHTVKKKKDLKTLLNYKALP